MIDFDMNLICYQYDKNLFTPKAIYPSGEKEEQSLIDKYNNKKELPLLILEDDIISKSGYGLKKGFYNIVPDKYLDYLLLYQSGALKAKVPVINMEIIEPINPRQEKVKKMSLAKYNREKEKERRKYLRGENPEELNYQSVEIKYIEEDNCYLIIYSDKNYELLGLIKF